MVGIGIPSQIMTLQTVANIVRIRLLLDGGVWVDASLFPTRPLNTWLPDLVRPSGFFAFAQPGADRALSTWFLAAAPGHMIPRTWLTAMLRYWATPRTMTHYEGGVIPPDPVWEVDPGGGAKHPTFPYFWFPYLFGHLLKTDAGFTAAWARCRKLSAEPPHRCNSCLPTAGQPTTKSARSRGPRPCTSSIGASPIRWVSRDALISLR